MGSIVSCGLKLVLQVFNTVLCVAFFSAALFGLLLRFSKPVVSNLLEKIFEGSKINEKEFEQMTKFLLDNANGISIILIIVGLVLGGLCLIGCIASCCGCGLLLKIYAGILLILVILEIIAVSIVFSDPQKLTNVVVKALGELLPFFNDSWERGEMAKAVWSFIMDSDDRCCGMDGYKDFTPLNGAYPMACCNHTLANCNSTNAEQTQMPGCRNKIVTFVADHTKVLLYVSIGAILLQAALFVIACLTIRL